MNTYNAYKPSTVFTYLFRNHTQKTHCFYKSSLVFSFSDILRQNSLKTRILVFLRIIACNSLGPSWRDVISWRTGFHWGLFDSLLCVWFIYNLDRLKLILTWFNRSTFCFHPSFCHLLCLHFKYQFAYTNPEQTAVIICSSNPCTNSFA
jgi:hypothetical protein